MYMIILVLLLGEISLDIKEDMLFIYDLPSVSLSTYKNTIQSKIYDRKGWCNLGYSCDVLQSKFGLNKIRIKWTDKGFKISLDTRDPEIRSIFHAEIENAEQIQMMQDTLRVYLKKFAENIKNHLEKFMEVKRSVEIENDIVGQVSVSYTIKPSVSYEVEVNMIGWSTICFNIGCSIEDIKVGLDYGECKTCEWDANRIRCKVVPDFVDTMYIYTY